MSLSRKTSTSAGSGGGGGGAIKVAVRVRPLLSSERGAPGAKEHLNVIGPDGLELRGKLLVFDAVFGTESTQTDLFQQSGAGQLLQAVLTGHTVTIMAYGQTGSGKTYTMFGLDERKVRDKEEHGGLMQRCLESLFNQLPADSSHAEHRVRLSFLEIYNETVRDLLNPNATLQVRQRPPPLRGFHVDGLTEIECASHTEASTVLRQGHTRRSVSSHQMNADSSRSHALVTVQIEMRAPGSTTPIRVGKIIFVDLAGSENLKAVGSSGVSTRETGQINKSLFALSTCIAILGDVGAGKKPRNTFIPFRDSVLTKLLMDSLGGNAFTLFIACVTPNPTFADETARTITYAARARNIKSVQTIQPSAQEIKDNLISQLQAELVRIREENDNLRRAIGSPGPPERYTPSVGQHSTVAAILGALESAGMPQSTSMADVPDAVQQALRLERENELLRSRVDMLERVFVQSKPQSNLSQPSTPFGPPALFPPVDYSSMLPIAPRYSGPVPVLPVASLFGGPVNGIIMPPLHPQGLPRANDELDQFLLSQRRRTTVLTDDSSPLSVGGRTRGSFSARATSPVPRSTPADRSSPSRYSPSIGRGSARADNSPLLRGKTGSPSAVSNAGREIVGSYSAPVAGGVEAEPPDHTPGSARGDGMRTSRQEDSYLEAYMRKTTTSGKNSRRRAAVS